MLSSMTNQLRVVFAGTPESAASALKSLIHSGVQIVGVLTREDASVGRTRELRSSAVAATASELGIEVYKANTIDNLARQWLESLSADIGVVVAYGSIFNPETLRIPRLGWLNLHFSLLPELRGAAPVQHAILSGKQETGVSVFRLDEGIDTGPVVSQKKVSIDIFDTSSTLLSRLTTVGSVLLAEILDGGEDLISKARDQEEKGSESIATKPTRDLARLDFTKGANSQFNKVRAMHPEPMAWFSLDESQIRVIQSRVLEARVFDTSVAGIFEKNLVVGCQNGSLVLEIVQPSGKKQMSGADWFRGLRAEKLMLS
jgi:methionyl-tRNA formyltransferase